MTTQGIFNQIASLASSGLAPEGRAAATSSSLLQIGTLAAGVEGVTIGDVKAGYERLALTRAGDDAPTGFRRKTCGEIAALIDAPAGDASKLAAVLDCVITAFSSSDDPRQKSMATTAMREAAELRETAES